MKTNNIIQEKSFNFAIEIIKTTREITSTQKEFVLSKQLLRCGTSIGANVEEAIGAQSTKDFFAKMTTAYKEARETLYWLRLLKETGIVSNQISEKLIPKAEELCRIIAAIQKSIKTKLNN